MRTIIKIGILTLIALSLWACGNNKKENANTEDSHSHTNEDGHSHNKESESEESSKVTMLTPEQIKAVGIAYGMVEQKELTAVIRANGNLKVPNNNKANATSLYGGAIRALYVQVGDYVKKGQVIASIVNPQFVQLQEEYLTLGNKLVFAEQELQRQRELSAGNAGAGKNLQSATAELNALRTRKASLQQQISMMGINTNGLNTSNLRTALTITSPLSGTISNVYAKIGSYVDVSSPVAEIVDNGSLHLDLQVFEKDMPLLKVGQIIHFTLTNNPENEYDATVFSIGSAFENESKTIPVHCKVKGNVKGLIDGMNISAIVSLNNAVMPAVPNSAIVEADGKFFVFIKKEPLAKKEIQHSHDDGHDHKHEEEKSSTDVTFEKIEVVKGVSNMGFTAITPVSEIPTAAKVVVNGAFFINAKMTNSGGEHGHAH